MDRVEMVVLVTEARDNAHEALRELKRLDRAGWIDLTYYALIDKDAGGGVHVQEASDPVETVSLVAVGANAGAALGKSTASESAQAGPDQSVQELDDVLPPGKSALMVVLEERYAERVVEELETRGRTIRKPLNRTEREAALRASVERVKTNVRWLEDLLHGELDKAERAAASEKEKFEATVAAGRAELGAERENLQARLKALGAELEADLLETRQRLQTERGAARVAIESRIDSLESAIVEYNESLATSIMDHMDSLASHALDLQAKAARASADTAKAIEEQLHELQVRMRKHRAELTATLGSSAVRARQCMDHLRVEAALGKAEMRQALQEHMKKLEERHEVLKADLRRLEKEDTRAWHELATGFRNSWRALSESVDQAKRQYR